MLDKVEIHNRLEKVPYIMLGNGEVYIEPLVYEETTAGVVSEMPSILLSIGHPIVIGQKPPKELLQKSNPVIIIIFRNKASFNCMMSAMKAVNKVFKRNQKTSNATLGNKIRDKIKGFKWW